MTTLKISLAEGYKEAQQAFVQSAELSDVKQTLDKFRILVNKNQVQGNERNIDWWARQGWPAFKDFVERKSKEFTASEIKKSRQVGNSINLAENDDWLILIPIDHAASCFHGKNTDWCITKPFGSEFHGYFVDESSTLVFCIQKKTMKKWAIEFGKVYNQTDGVVFYDINDKTITAQEFESQTGLKINYIFSLMNRPGVSDRVSAGREHMRSEFERAERVLKEFRARPKQSSFAADRDPDLERLLFTTKNSFALRMYLNTMFERWGFQSYGNTIEMLTATLLPGMIGVFRFPGEKIQKRALDSSQGTAIGTMLEHYDTIRVSENMITYALNLNGENLQFVAKYAPDLLDNRTIVRTALDKTPRAIFYVKNPSDEDIDYAISRDYRVLMDIPKESVTDERIITALKLYLKKLGNDELAWDSVTRFLSRRKDIIYSDTVLEWIMRNLDYGVPVITNLYLNGKITEFSPKIKSVIAELNPAVSKLMFPEDYKDSKKLGESRSVLLEKRRGKISHPEDLVWQGGYEGYKTALAALDFAQRNPTSIQVKWDGSPAIIFGRDPATGELIVTDKAGFGAKKYDGLARSQRQLFDMIYNRNPGSPERKQYALMFANLWPLFERAVPGNLRGFYHSDLMYAGVPEVKDSAYQFQQNKIVYRVPVNSELGKRIANSRAGIVVHGFYKDNTQTTPDAVYNTDDLAGFAGLLVIPPMTASKSIKPAKFSVSADYQQMDSLFDPATLKQEKISDLSAVIGKYVNQMAVNGKSDYSKAVTDFIEWLPVSGVHAQKQDRMIAHIKNNLTAFKTMWRAINNVTKIKSYIKRQLDQQPYSDIYPYLQNKQMHEGYVAETPYGLIKLVDRNLFMAKETTNPKFER
jgi:hypothetical protein